MLSQVGKLDVAVLVWFCIGLPVAIYVCIKQGFGRHAGWLYLVSLPLVRIVGSSLRIAADQKPSVGLYTGAAILNSIGLVPLLLAFMGMLKRVNDGMKSTKITPRVFQLTHLMTIVGLALGIAAGVNSTSKSASDLSSAVTFRKVAAVLLFLSAVINILLDLILLAKIREAWDGDRIIIYCTTAAAPFLLVRVIYTMLVAFDHSPKFNYASVNVFVQAFMQSLMEFIIFALYCAAGLLAESMKGGVHGHGKGIELLPGKRNIDSSASYDHNGQQELGQIPAQR